MQVMERSKEEMKQHISKDRSIDMFTIEYIIKFYPYYKDTQILQGLREGGDQTITLSDIRYIGDKLKLHKYTPILRRAALKNDGLPVEKSPDPHNPRVEESLCE